MRALHYTTVSRILISCAIKVGQHCVIGIDSTLMQRWTNVKPTLIRRVSSAWMVLFFSRMTVLSHLNVYQIKGTMDKVNLYRRFYWFCCSQQAANSIVISDFHSTSSPPPGSHKNGALSFTWNSMLTYTWDTFTVYLTPEFFSENLGDKRVFFNLKSS